MAAPLLLRRTARRRDAAEGLRDLVDDLGEIDARDISTVPLGEDLVLRVGRYGPYVEVDRPRRRRGPRGAQRCPTTSPPTS